MRLSGLSYGSSIAYPHRTRFRIAPRHELLQIVLEFVHPGNLGPLPPDPNIIAFKGEQLGIAKFSEFWKEEWY